MSLALRAGFLYFALVFPAGFMLGALRVFALAPQLGKIGAVLIELPVMLLISWWVCGAVIRRMALQPAIAPRTAMGIFAFVLLMIAELCLAMSGLGRTVAEHLQSYRAWDTAIGLAGQLVFAAFPLMQMCRR